MIVKLRDINSLNTDLSPNSAYRVISIDLIQSSELTGCFEVKYRVVNDNGIAALYDLNIFEVVNSEIEADFVYKSYDNGNFELIPKSMSYMNFWDSFFDDDEKAIEIFKSRFPEYRSNIF